MDEKCPHCQKKKPKQHQRFCRDNPNRVNGPGRPKGGAPAQVVTPISSAPLEVAFEIQETDRVEAEMPNLDRPPVQETAPPAAQQVPIQVATGPLVDVMCGFFERGLNQEDAAQSGIPEKPEPITAEERKAIAEALDPILAKYLPLGAKYAIEVNAVMVTLAVFGPRLMAARKRKAWREAEAKRPRHIEEIPAAPAAAPTPDYNGDAGADFLRRLQERGG